MKFSLPNIISLIRVIIAPIFFLMLISGEYGLIHISCILYLIGAVTDYIDGWLARKYQDITSWGKFFDPLADKILTTSAFIAFVILHIIPLWMVIVIIIRDFGTTFLRAYADNIDKPIVTSLLAKWKTFLQMLFIAYILTGIFIISIVDNPNLGGLLNDMIYSSYTYVAMLLLTLLTIWSGIEYIIQNKGVINSLWLTILGKNNAS